jgi:hypothetical protein
MSFSRFMPLIAATLLLLPSCGGNDPAGPDPNLLRITTTSLPNAVQNVDYGPVTLTATGGDGSYTWALAPGSFRLPYGLSLSASGVITGTPTEWGWIDFTVQVASAGQERQANLMIVVAQSP